MDQSNKPMNAYDIVRTGVADAMSGLNTLGAGRMAMARELAARNYNQSVREDEREYQRQNEERRRKEKKDDESEERLRKLRVQYASLGGKSNPESFSEEELSALVDGLARDRAIKLREEDSIAQTNLEIKKADALSDAAFKKALADKGISSDGKPRDVLVKELAAANIAQQVEQAQLLQTASIEAAKKTSGYQNIIDNLGDLYVQRQKAIEESVIPDFNTELTPEERKTIYSAAANVIAMSPSSAARKFMKDPRNMTRLSSAVDAAGAAASLETLSQSEQAELMGIIGSKADQMEQALSKQKEFKYSAGMRNYMSGVRSLPDRINTINREIDRLHSLGDKSGLPIGLALQTENSFDLMKKALDRQGAGVMSKDPQKNTSGLNPLPKSGASSDSSWYADNYLPKTSQVGGGYTSVQQPAVVQTAAGDKVQQQQPSMFTPMSGGSPFIADIQPNSPSAAVAVPSNDVFLQQIYGSSIPQVAGSVSPNDIWARSVMAPVPVQAQAPGLMPGAVPYGRWPNDGALDARFGDTLGRYLKAPFVGLGMIAGDIKDKLSNGK